MNVMKIRISMIHALMAMIYGFASASIDMSNAHTVLKSTSRDLSTVSLAESTPVISSPSTSQLGSPSTDKQSEIDLYNYCRENIKISGQEEKKLFCIRCVNHTEAMYGRLVEQRRCEKCKYTITHKNKTCGFYLNESQYLKSRSAVGNIQNCEGVYGDTKSNKASCFMCQEGYALYRDKDSNIHTCTKSSINRCVVSEMIGKKEKCYVCSRGYPSPDFSTCQNEEILARENCYFGMRHESYYKGKHFCALCENNYALVDQQLSNTTEESPATCQIVGKPDLPTSDRCPHGCGRCNVFKQCMWCNHYYGYYMTDINQCTYRSFKLTLSILALIILAAAFS